MKSMKLLFLVIAVFSAAALQAQKSPQARARVAEIRKMYSSAKETMTRNDNSGEFRSDMKVEARYIVPGTGPTKETVHYYYELQNDGEEGVAFYQPYFITRSYNVAARKFYQEFLFDTEKHELVFAYESEENFEGGTDEVRCYWGVNGRGETGLVHKIEKGKPFADENSLLQKSSALVGSLNMFINQGD